MGNCLTYKILESHLVSGRLAFGEEIAIHVDQTLTQDATGTMAYLQFEAMGFPRVQTELSVSYVDHNMLQTGFENADDHLYLQSAAAKYGIYFSRAGNGICHQVHLERFSSPGRVLLGSDSHTPTCGGAGMLAIGVGGLDVAVAMGGAPFSLRVPKVLGIRLEGKLPPWVSAKDVILEVLRRISVKGGVGKILEYYGPGVATLSVPDRGTITNMGAETGATTSIFPSDEETRYFLKAQGREEIYVEIGPDPDAHYDEEMTINLSELVPLVALPHSPDNVKPINEVEGIKVQQVIVGSCTNSSIRDIRTVASILSGKTVHPSVSFAVTPGSRQVLQMMSADDTLLSIVSAGARILESACGPCIGMGLAPPSKGVSLRSFNRNFPGRSGTKDAEVYLCSPELAAASALTGVITDPRKLEGWVEFKVPEEYIIDDQMIIPPAEKPDEVQVVRGPNIAPLPIQTPLPESIKAELLLKVGDNITTDHIMPAGSRVLPYRSNIPKCAEFVFEIIDKTFPERAKKAGAGIVVGGSNYGQGSSREHAGLAPAFLGVKAVIVKSFARIHRANLINFGILPLLFSDPEDYDKIEQGDELEITKVRTAIANGAEVKVLNRTKGTEFTAKHDMTKREVEIMLDGGLLNYTKNQAAVKT